MLIILGMSGRPITASRQLAETRHSNGSYNYFRLNYIFERKTNLFLIRYFSHRSERTYTKLSREGHVDELHHPPLLSPPLFSSLLHCPYRGLLSRSPSIPLVSTLSSDFLRAIGAIRDRPGTNSISG